MRKITTLRLQILLFFIGATIFSVWSQSFTPLITEEKGAIYAADIPELCVFSKFKYNHIKLGIANENGQSQWLSNKKQITVKRRGYSIKYSIKSPLLNNGELHVEAAALKQGFGYILRITGVNIPQGISIICATGDADRDLADETKNHSLVVAPPVRTTFCTEANSIDFFFGQEMKFTAIQMTVSPESEIQIADFNQMETPLQFWNSGKKTDRQLLAVKNRVSQTPFYIICGRQRGGHPPYSELPELFNREYQKQ